MTFLMRILQMINSRQEIISPIFKIFHRYKDVLRCWKYEIIRMRKLGDLVLDVIWRKDGKFIAKFQGGVFLNI